MFKSAASTHMRMPAAQRMPDGRRYHDMLSSWADKDGTVLVCPTEKAFSS